MPASHKPKIDWVLLLLCIVPFGFDKLYKKDGVCFVVKMVSSLLLVGFVWWGYDIVCVLIDKYQPNPFLEKEIKAE